MENENIFFLHGGKSEAREAIKGAGYDELVAMENQYAFYEVGVKRKLVDGKVVITGIVK